MSSNCDELELNVTNIRIPPAKEWCSRDLFTTQVSNSQFSDGIKWLKVFGRFANFVQTFFLIIKYYAIATSPSDPISMVYP